MRGGEEKVGSGGGGWGYARIKRMERRKKERKKRACLIQFHAGDKRLLMFVCHKQVLGLWWLGIRKRKKRKEKKMGEIKKIKTTCLKQFYSAGVKTETFNICIATMVSSDYR